jgi:aspartyl-tRNA(Asn)/glutamyl-tRNA(Gln) amidotransferase subunit C
MISKEDIRHIAELCKLKFSEEELENYREKFSEILKYASKLKEVNTDGVKPTYFVNTKLQPLREDIVVQGLSKEEAIKNAPEEQYGYFKLLRVMD